MSVSVTSSNRNVTFLENEDREIRTKPTYTISEMVLALQTAVNDEVEAINKYDVLLATAGLTSEQKAVIKRIKEEEQDHLVTLTEILDEVTKEEFPKNGMTEEPESDEDEEITEDDIIDEINDRMGVED